MFANLKPYQRQDLIHMTHVLWIPFVGFWIWYLSPILFTLVFWVLIGMLIPLIVLGLATPLFVGRLVNYMGPNNEHPSGPYFFTFLEEGEVKIVVRGKIVVRMMMMFAGHVFAREGNLQSPEYWDIKVSNGNSDNIFPEVVWLLRPWARYVYKYSGAVFVGFYPFQRLREYRLARINLTQQATGEYTTSAVDDWSDHLRARQFTMHVRVPEADTRDNMQVSILLAVRMHVTGPYRTAFSTDRWLVQILNMVVATAATWSKTHNLNQVLTAKDGAEAEQLNNEIRGLENDTLVYGVDIDGVDILDVSAILSDAQREQLQSPAIATAQAAAVRTAAKAEKDKIIAEGQGHAQAITDMAAAVEAGGDSAKLVVETEGRVRIAEANTDGLNVMNVGGGATIDPIAAAILKELRTGKES